MKRVKMTVGAFMLATVGMVFGETILFSEDFNSYAVDAPINGVNGFSVVGASSSQGTQTNYIGAFSSYFNGGGRSLYVTDNNTDTSVGNQMIYNSPAAISGAEPVIFSFEFNVRTNGLQNPTFSLHQGSTTALTLNFFNVTGKVRNNPNGTGLVDVSPYVLSTSYWYRVEITVSNLSSSTDTYDLKIWEGRDTADGVLVIDVEGLAFRNDVPYVDKFWFGTAANNGTFGTRYNIDNISVRSLNSTPVAQSGFLVCLTANNFPADREKILALGNLTDTPAVYDAEGYEPDGGARAVFFDALPWKGSPTRVFAWLGVPTNRIGKVPGIVLVHGGGGTAYKDWVKLWNDHGYAAISIAVEGQTDENLGTIAAPVWKKHAWAGPVRVGRYEDSGEPLADQWMYHAVADTVLANSLLRSLPEVDAGKVGIMGVSWGGIITSTTIGIDDRFAFGIPTYGCGHLFDAYSKNGYGPVLSTNRFYREVWDPMVRMHRVNLPVLWLSWPEEPFFPLDCQAATYRAAPGSRMVTLVPGLGHGHKAAWNPPYSYAFADSIVLEGELWCRQIGASMEGSIVRVEFSSTKNLTAARLISTVDTGPTDGRRWNTTVANLVQNEGSWSVTAELPEGTTAWFINVDSGDITTSSDYHEVK